MATGPDDDDGDDAFGSFDDDDGFGSFDDADATGTDASSADAADHPTHYEHVMEPTANNSTEEAENDRSLPPSVPVTATDADISGDASNNNDVGDGSEDNDIIPSSEDTSPPPPPTDDTPSSDIPPPEPEQLESDTPMSAPSPPPPPPEISSAEEAMESADETTTAPNAFMASLPEGTSPDGEVEAGSSADADMTATGCAMMTTSPPPLGGASADDHNDDPFASLGGASGASLPVLSGSTDAAEGFGSLGGFGDTAASGGENLLGDAGADADADADADIPEAETGADEDDNEATSTDIPITEPKEVKTPTAAAAGGFPSEEAEAEVGETDTNTETNGAEAADIISTEPPLVPSANPPLDQFSSFVTAATEEEEASGAENAAPSTYNQEDEDEQNEKEEEEEEEEDDFGGFEDAASEEEEKKDGSPIANKLSTISDTAESTAPPALPLEADDDTPADSFGAFDDGASDGSDQKADVLEAVSSDVNGCHDESADATEFGAFGDVSTSVEEPTPVSDESPAEVTQTKELDTGKSGTEAVTVGETNGFTGSEEAALDAGDEKLTEPVELSVVEPSIVENNGDANGFDAFAEVSSPTLVNTEALTDPAETEKSVEGTNPEDRVDAFAEAPTVAEQKEATTELIGIAIESSSSVDAPPVDAPETPDEHVPDSTAAITSNKGFDVATPNQGIENDGFDAFAEAPASSPKEAESKLIGEVIEKVLDAPASVLAPAPDESKLNGGESAENDEDKFDDDFGDFDDFAEAPAPLSPPEEADREDVLDAPASASAPAPALDASELDGGKTKEEEEDESDDDFGDFGDFGGINEAEEIPSPAGANGIADIHAKSEVPHEEDFAPPTAEEGGGGGKDDDDDDDDDDFGDFGAFDETPAPEPVAAISTVPISPLTAPKADPTPTDEEFATSFEEQASAPTVQSTQAESDPIIHKAMAVCKGMFQQYAPSLPEEKQQEEKNESSNPVKSILDSILAGGSTSEPSSSSLSSKEQIENIFSETEIERGPATIIMNYDMPKPYAQYSADSGADLKTDRGLSLEASSHSNDGDIFVPEVLSIDLPKESELSPEPRAPKVQPSAEFVDFPMSATRVEIPDKKEGNSGGGFADFGASQASAIEPATPAVAEAASAVDKFLAKIPDLSFMLSKELVLPK